VSANGEIGFRYVRAGTPARDGRVPILSGLGGGEQIATDPIAAGVAYKQQSGAGNE
jgi:hypothetical protein